MIQPGGDPIARATEWHRKAVETPPGTPDYGDKVDRFNRDFDGISKLDGSQPFMTPMTLYAGDRDPAPGSVDVPGVGSLKQTAEGFTLNVIRQGLYGAPIGWATYRVNTAAHTIEATQASLPFANGFFFSAGGTESYTLHTDTQTVTDHRRGPLPDS